jgi:NAD(P)-dependent dehydrogenase (short-subunit alcohol dehydrogenase family)
MAGILAAPKMGAYAAAKHAVVGLTRTAAVEYGRANIRVNAMCPYFTPTNIGDGFLKSDETAANLSRGCPMKRIARVDEIIAPMLFAISPANSFLNGQTLGIDGGVSAI